MDNTNHIIAKRNERKTLLLNSFVEVKETPLVAAAQTRRKIEKGVAKNITKSVAPELEKGLKKEKKAEDGILGHCRSGKPIYSNFENPAHARYDYWDHEDAARKHAELSEAGDAKAHIKEGNKHYEKGLKMRSSIGQTESGKAVYKDFEHEDHKNFTKKDHNDAAKLHIGEMQRASYSNDTERSMHHNKQYAKHMEASTGKSFSTANGGENDMMKAMSECKTTADVVAVLEKGGVEIFGERQIEAFMSDLRKGFDDDEISRADWEKSTYEAKSMPSVIVKSADGNDDIKVYYRQKK